MRDQYAGDVSDLLKFAFLRSLAGANRRLGVAWYYVPHNDGRADGRHLEWRDDPAWSGLDAHLVEQLSVIPARTVEALEQLRIWPPATSFHREAVSEMKEREGWSERQCKAFEKSDLVFIDPDNGLGSATERHATMAEVKALRKTGRALAFITFPGRTKKHPELVRDLHLQLANETGATGVFTLRTSVSLRWGTGRIPPRTRWFTVLDADDELRGRGREYAAKLAGIPGVTVEVLGL